MKSLDWLAICATVSLYIRRECTGLANHEELAKAISKAE